MLLVGNISETQVRTETLCKHNTTMTSMAREDQQMHQQYEWDAVFE